MTEIKDCNEKIKSRPNLTFHDFMHLILSNWYWFILSLILFGLAAEYYIRRTPPVYQRTASIQIKDSRKGTGAELAAFSDIAGITGRNSVDNEIHILESYSLMERVVNKYNLATTYTTKGRIRTTDLYGRVPMTVSFIDISPRESGSFSYTMDDEGNAHIKGFSEEGFSATVAPGDTITTPLGAIVMTPTKYFDKYKHLEVKVSRSTLNNAVEHYRKKLECEIADKQSSVINLTMNDEVAQRAEDVINGIIDAYDEDGIKDKLKIADITEQLINERLAILSEELNIADANIAKFKQDNQLYSPENEATMISEEITKLNTQLIALNNEISVAEFMLEAASQNQDDFEAIPVLNITSGGSNAAYVAEINTYNEYVLDYKRLKGEAAENNPVVVTLQSQLSTMRQQITKSLTTHIEGLKLQLGNLNNELDSVYGSMQGSPNREKELMAMMRDQSVKQQLYLYLKTKGEENALTRSNADSNASVIDRAHGSNEPISPHTTLIYMLAFVVGLLIPFAILYICELLNTKVRSHKEVESAISAPFAGIIPRYEGKRHGHDIVVREDGRDNISEAFRILRTNLNFMSVDNPIKVIMLTSSVPHSGKTFVASNLAMTLAMSDKRVIIVDLDLRRRTLTKLMGHRNDRRGVTSYLTGGIEALKDNITTNEQNSNLDMLFAGPQPPNPTELLMSKRMEELIEALRQSYDYIVIDSVPAMAVADAMVVDRYVDHTIYVVRQGNLDRRQLPDIEALHTEKRFHNMSILFNGATISKRSYGYGYTYYGYDDEGSTWKGRWTAFKKLFRK